MALSLAVLPGLSSLAAECTKCTEGLHSWDEPWDAEIFFVSKARVTLVRPG